MLAGIEGGGLNPTDSDIPSSMQLSGLPVKVSGTRPINGNPALGDFPLQLEKDTLIAAQRDYGQVEEAVDLAKQLSALRNKKRSKLKELHGIVLDDKEHEMQTALNMTQRQALHGRKVQKFAFNVEMEQALNGGYLDTLTNAYSFLAV